MLMWIRFTSAIHSWADWVRVLDHLPPSVKIVSESDCEISASRLRDIVERYSLSDRARDYKWCLSRGLDDLMVRDADEFSICFRDFC